MWMLTCQCEYSHCQWAGLGPPRAAHGPRAGFAPPRDAGQFYTPINVNVNMSMWIFTLSTGRAGPAPARERVSGHPRANFTFLPMWILKYECSHHKIANRSKNIYKGIKIEYKGISVQENSVNQEKGLYGIKLYIHGTKWVKKFLHGLLGLKHF